MWEAGCGAKEGDAANGRFLEQFHNFVSGAAAAAAAAATNATHEKERVQRTFLWLRLGSRAPLPIPGRTCSLVMRDRVPVPGASPSTSATVTLSTKAIASCVAPRHRSCCKADAFV